MSEELSAAGVLELAWSTGLVSWDATNGGWFDTESGEVVAEARARRALRGHGPSSGAASVATSTTARMVDNTAPLLASVYLDDDLTFTVGDEAEAQAMRDADPEHTVIAPDADGDWTVTRKAGTEIRVPRRMKLTRTVGGQIPTGLRPRRSGASRPRWSSRSTASRSGTCICTVDAFLSSGLHARPS